MDLIDETIISIDYELRRYELLFEHIKHNAILEGKLSDFVKNIFFTAAEEYIMREKKVYRFLKEKVKNQKPEFSVPLKDARKRISVTISNFYNIFSKTVMETLLPNSKDAFTSIEYRRIVCYIATLAYPCFSAEERVVIRGKILENFNQALYLAGPALKPWDELNCQLILNYASFQYICFGNVDDGREIIQKTLYKIEKMNDTKLTPKALRIIQSMVHNINTWGKPKVNQF